MFGCFNVKLLVLTTVGIIEKFRTLTLFVCYCIEFTDDWPHAAAAAAAAIAVEGKSLCPLG